MQVKDYRDRAYALRARGVGAEDRLDRWITVSTFIDYLGFGGAGSWTLATGLESLIKTDPAILRRKSVMVAGGMALGMILTSAYAKTICQTIRTGKADYDQFVDWAVEETGKINRANLPIHNDADKRRIFRTWLSDKDWENRFNPTPLTNKKR